MISGKEIKVNNCRISIIIPVYNASSYLRRCLDSLLCQTIQQFEVWLINDGSTDGSGDICDEYAKYYPNFYVHHDKNNGVSYARNIGIENAIGKYITFVDADDYVENNFLQMMLPHNNEDFSVCGCKIIRYDGSIDVENISCFDYEQEPFNSILNHHLARTVWGKMFKRELVNRGNLRFDTSLRIGEDTLFILNFLCNVQSVYISDEIGYIYIKPQYKINKYRMTPYELINLYRQFRFIEVKLEESGYPIQSLKKNNKKTVGFNLLTLLYLSGKYSFSERHNYILDFKYIGKSVDGNIGLSGYLGKIYNLFEAVPSPRLQDIFLCFVMRLIWFKAKALKS
ncbi:glycosyltransferase family 2 protein [Sphingobacterium olei]|uniref:Glycosyltransferase family 2 protein n=1 Tax=Sphingobacterium olei TaxID=2571155 RepID=A0A4U0PB45_9SPHI|nr:glycosyltransferase [Sphingobacterium olei]TJZ59884.1 glycosyltransferase family 2 protein [Sphingobacterium olei]